MSAGGQAGLNKSLGGGDDRGDGVDDEIDIGKGVDDRGGFVQRKGTKGAPSGRATAARRVEARAASTSSQSSSAAARAISNPVNPVAP